MVDGNHAVDDNHMVDGNHVADGMNHEAEESTAV